MKTKQFILLLFFISLKIHSQCTDYVYIPDASFKFDLVSNTSINTNGDEEISCEEATLFTGKIDSYALDLTGIEAFTNITELVIQTARM